MPSLDWIAVDWGTTNVRAWGMDSGGSVLFERASPKGMARISPGDYGQTLADLAGSDIGDRSGVEVLICGMAGARQGWREAPYVEVPATFAAIAAGCVVPETTDRRFTPRIVPGLCQRLPADEEVMRGEETQILGLLTLQPAFEGTVIMPGTHSKWVTISKGGVERFATAMTGELYDVLTNHSVLRLTVADAADGAARDDGIWAGLGDGLDDPQLLSSRIFRTRTAALLSGRDPGWCAGYLSGLLIGSEIAARRHWLGPVVPIIGPAGLQSLYARALERLGIGAELIDAGRATLNGLRTIRNRQQ